MQPSHQPSSSRLRPEIDLRPIPRNLPSYDHNPSNNPHQPPNSSHSNSLPLPNHSNSVALRNGPALEDNPANRNNPIEGQQEQSMFDSLTRGYWGFVASPDNLRFIQSERLLFLSSKIEVVSPYKQSFGDMLRTNYSPHFRCFSLTTLLLLTVTIYFIVAVSIGLNKRSFLEVGSQTLHQLGINNAKMVYQGQVYRLILGCLLHLNAAHLVGNLIIVVGLVPAFEHSFGVWRVLAALLVTAVSGSIVSDLLSVDSGSQMSKAGFHLPLLGLIGMGCGWLVLNWPALVRVGVVFKCNIILTLFLFLVFIIIFAEKALLPNYSGMLGSFVSGVFIAFILPLVQTGTRQTILQVSFAILLIGMNLSCFLVFYLSPHQAYLQ